TPRPIVLSGPSGAGKSTFLKRLFAQHPDKFGFSISHTTRSPRAGEVNGVDYHFVTKEEFLAGVERGEFIEHAEFSGNHYGTTKKAFRDVGEQGKICIFDIDMQGVIQVKNTDINPHYISVQPPSIDELEKRLRGRGTEKESSIKARLEAAEGELEYAKQEGSFDVIFVNDDLEGTYTNFKAFIDKVTV
ncbi:hypothetical protein BGZ76_011012, partial [Entomortierella beljakovae]